MPRLILSGLSKRFGDVQALDGVSLEVAPGEIYGFVGSNGAGKSTAMRIALGVLSADAGTVFIDDQEMDATQRRRIGYMPEERGLYAKEKLVDQLAFFGSLHGIDKAASREKAMSLLEQLGLAERAGDKLETLSLGNQQRVQLAASLIHDPDVLVLDEPFSGLDPVAVDVMSELLVERAAKGVAVLFSSHQLGLVQKLCDRIGIITKGKMRAQGPVDELRSRGPVVYEVATPADPALWAPAGAVVTPRPTGVLVELPGDLAEAVSDQDLLTAALAHGPVHSFGRYVPDLTELFKEVVSQ
ncbi:ABC transporter ATP-binding protein [Corynebacterium vitaeruminis]|uniref:ABC transporter ATP-binding protein n=1 Tax=Corynebacterium vitaeruminis DSM 20294 TaxID=1224164 RepID=W5Y9W8_9CORY|nr:ATP-binding cassette domain-containing protein [Corynebacterium vitaeruminis]AHI23328.1 ABC transporter ATP-binding protein [Corynebacterium vitaeruminis DSM 20294]